MIERIIDFAAHNKFLVHHSRGGGGGGGGLLRWAACRSTPSRTSPTRRSSSTRAGTAARTSSRTRSPIRSSRRMLGAPKVKAIRGFSDFGFSYVYVIFQDGTDLYWARSRTLEYLSKIQPRLPRRGRDGARARRHRRRLGLPVRAGGQERQEQPRRSSRIFQDWYLRYWLQSVPGVAEVASIGGFQKQYQVNIDPSALLAYDIPITKVIDAIRAGQQRRRRTARRVQRRGVHGPRPRVRQVRPGHRRTSRWASTRAARRYS